MLTGSQGNIARSNQAQNADHQCDYACYLPISLATLLLATGFNFNLSTRDNSTGLLKLNWLTPATLQTNLHLSAV